MKNLILALVIFSIGCQKEEKCNFYIMVTESNVEEAYAKCQGYANDYPYFKKISSESIGCLTSEQLKIARRNENSSSVNICNGVVGTTRVVIK